MTLVKACYVSPIGELSLVADETGLVGAWFLGQAHFERGIKEPVEMGDSVILLQAVEWLESYFAGEVLEVAVPLSPQGTAFQQRVWSELATIPYGQTCTYKALADRLQCRSSQAVGGAVGKNPLSIFIPCHRILGSDGSLTGYAGGLERKSWLLAHEERISKSTD
ncbi:MULTISPECIES: methylated-DNA--[protein]-cysteine S-methyltransferase [unclassified Streptococcus]|uniref:methylated-DNA--[protein]-cysteine S-methyltransferase n=1 Tax=unclassified Streptococcus TaxID=2608887 RepID=UPI00359EF271